MSKTFGHIDDIIEDWGFEEVDVQDASGGSFTLPAADGLQAQTYTNDGGEITPEMADYSA